MVGLFSYPKRQLKKLVQEGEYKEALELGKSLEEKNPYDPDLLFIMGSIYYILEDAKNAIYYFDKVLEISEYDQETLFLKANVHIYLKENKIAIDCCKKILEIDPEHKQAREMLDKLEEQ